MLGPHLILLAKESDRDEGDAGDEEEDLEEDEEVEQVNGGLRQLKRSPLRPRHHLKLENTFYILMNNLYFPPFFFFLNRSKYKSMTTRSEKSTGTQAYKHTQAQAGLSTPHHFLPSSPSYFHLLLLL